MTRKILLGLFILLMCAVSFIAYNFYKNVKEPVSQTSFEAIPTSAALIIKENNFKAVYTKLKSTNIIWDELTTNTESAAFIKDQLNYFDSLLNGPFQSVVTSNSITGSLHLSGANSYDFIFYLTVPEIEEQELINKIKTSTKSNPSSRSYDGVNIYNFSNGDKKVALTYYKNTVAFSYSTVLIEDVIRQLNTESNLVADSSFAKVIRASGRSDDGNLFVNGKVFPKIISQYLNKGSKTYFQGLENFIGWTELDITIKPNTIAFNGFSFASDKNSIHQFKNQSPQEIEMLEIVPYNAAYIYHYGISNPETFLENRKSLLKKSNQFFNYQKFIDEQVELYGIDLEVELLGHISSEIGCLITESQTEDFSNNKYIIYKTADIDKAFNDLNLIASKINPERIDTATFNGFRVNHIPMKNLFHHLLGKPFINLEEHYFTAIEDYVVFGNSKNALKNFILNFRNNKVLTNDENFEAFNENLSSESNIFIYNNIARSIHLYKTLSKEKYLTVFDDKIDVFRKFEAIAYQMNTEKNNLYYSSLFLKYNPIYKQETTSLWELALDTFTSNAPQIITNHKTQSKEIIVQDDANKLYLISNTGKIIWTKQLAEKVMGKFHQIDAYKNNKLQLLFNTKSKLYLIDRNGNNVEKFPIKLPAEASIGVTPLDYEKSRNYRLLIGCRDNMVYNYDVTGTPIKGWEYSSTSPASTRIWHFASAGKDYIVIPLNNGQIKIVERSGKDRITLKNMLPITNNIHLKVGSSITTTYLSCLDTNSTVIKVFLNDKKEASKFEDVPANSTFNLFDYNIDRVHDYLFTWNQTIFIASPEQKELLSLELPSSITDNPLIFAMDDNRLGIVSSNQIYLINNNGQITDGFPLAGSTLFHIADINNDNTLNLVVAHENMIYTYNLK